MSDYSEDMDEFEEIREKSPPVNTNKKSSREKQSSNVYSNDFTESGHGLKKKNTHNSSVKSNIHEYKESDIDDDLAYRYFK